ncbi:histidine kinase [Niabella sp. CC-SYL272]|uniref:ligand-binding sensor domain-containing protein n=1 Tax=Niabella agricola TaxID=2891571 RepID=UPI001F20C023|nr:sensor histidine kinase [Niabella agricola]MCF3110663.1 histidine kinase [Niabella agricola]
MDKGLSQSQVTSITQDVRHYLWIGTIAGLNRFDGARFKTFTKKDGILSNVIMALYSASNGDVWISTTKGLSRYDGYRFGNLKMPVPKTSHDFSVITEDASGNIYAYDFWNGLFVVKGNTITKVPLPPGAKSPTCSYRDQKKKLWVYFYQQGFYELLNGTWTKKIELPGLMPREFVRSMTESNGIYYAITNKGTLLKIQGEHIIQRKQYNGSFKSINIDEEHNLWIAAAHGALLIDSGTLLVKEVLNAQNGLSDNMVNIIFKDNNGNCWFGTDGDGLFKYSGGPFIRYDKNNGLIGNVVMGFAKDKNGQLFTGTREGALLKYNAAKKTFQPIDPLQKAIRGVNCLGSDPGGNIYVGTMENRLLKISNGRVSEILLEKDYRPGIFTIKSYGNKVCVHTTMGSYWVEGTRVQKIVGAIGAVNSIALGNNEILAGGSKGCFIFASTGAARPLRIPELEDVNIACFEQVGNYIVIGSFDEGLFFWDQAHNRVRVFNRESGLADNNVFAIMKDSGGNLWVGTSSGVQQLQLDTATGHIRIRLFNIADGYEPSETNLNAMIEGDDHSIWIGTTKGVYIYNPVADRKRTVGIPVTVIESVDYPGCSNTKKEDLSVWEHLPKYPKIAFANNSISFNFKGIYLRDPASLLYTYKLEGYDTAFSRPQRETSLNYMGLPPGRYVFKVRAVTHEGVVSANTVAYPFTIITPYYKTTWFMGLLVLSLVGIGWATQLIYTNQQRKRRKEIRKIQEQEQQKIREQTAADFHDELGNKLTRISILADVLQHKTDPADEEKNKIIRQIKSNALGLYTGTREIIWSLSKESNNLNEVLLTIRQTGMELFSDTAVQFVFTGLPDTDAAIKIPPGYNRHIIMIFKELLSNSMRHAGATRVMIVCRKLDPDKIGIYFTDNGIGFNKDQTRGHGLNNIQQRAEKIGGHMQLRSARHEGTSCSLIFSLKQ